MKIGLFFGSFNPIHVGHLIIANAMACTTDLDAVWLVVSPQNPHKKSRSLLHEFDRFDMVEMAIDGNPALKACDIEFSMPKPSYTIDTLTRLQEKYPQHSFALIVGEDNLLHFDKWKNHDKILEYYGMYVYPRPSSAETELKKHAQVKLVDAPLLDISATFIRECVHKNRSIKYLVPERVEEYILRKKFFV
ncbi:MAG: nicotinate (nicotinamide) nucleotide adenylyltransferase [Bacteroidota bacterium]